MDRIKRVRTGNFTTIDNTICRDKRASMECRGLLLTVMSLPDDWEFTVLGLVTICEESKNSIYRIINKLMELGYVTRTSRPKVQGKFSGSDYTFYENPEDRIPKTVSRFEDTEIGTQLNTNKERESPKSDSSHAYPQAYVYVNGEYVGTSDDFFANLEEKGTRQGEQGLLIDLEVPDKDTSVPIPDTAHKVMYNLCYLAETIEQQMFLDSRQRGRVASVLGKMRDADADFNKLSQFKDWWSRFWKSKDRSSGQYQPPTPEQVLEYWTIAMAQLNGAGPPVQTQGTTAPSLREIEEVMRKQREGQ